MLYGWPLTLVVLAVGLFIIRGNHDDVDSRVTLALPPPLVSLAMIAILFVYLLLMIYHNIPGEQFVIVAVGLIAELIYSNRIMKSPVVSI